MQFRTLDRSGVAAIHQTALDMLDNIGMDVAGDEPRGAFLDAGARQRGGRIMIGPDLVEKTLAAVPAGGFELVGRDPARRVSCVPGEVHFRPAGGLPFTIDYPSGKRRGATMEDAGKIVRVVDALDGIEISNSAVSPADSGVGIRNVLRFVNAVRNSSKPTDLTASGPDEIAAVAEIATIIRGSKEALQEEPLVLFYVSATSPMRLSESEALAVMECAKRELPLTPLPCPTLAATAPATMAGAVAQQWAEGLALMVLAYSIRPGLPLMSCSRLNPVDMRRGNTILSGGACGLMSAAAAEVAAAFNLPLNAWGLASASHEADLQAGAERVINAMLAVWSGVNVVSGAGTLGNALISTAEQLVIDNEIIGMLRHVSDGVEVTPETLARDYLAEGVRDGTFLMCEHTLSRLHSGKDWMADLFTTAPYDTWMKEGTTLTERATGRVEEILRTHEVSPIDPAADKEIDSFLRAAGI